VGAIRSDIEPPDILGFADKYVVQFDRLSVLTFAVQTANPVPPSPPWP